MKFRLMIALAFVSELAFAQIPGEDVFVHRENANYSSDVVRIPDIDGYITLKGDFHMHTIFSDGEVWPAFRVTEARRTGLDIIAMTDHIEYRKYTGYLNDTVDFNTSYEIARKAVGDKKDLIVIHGIEITRSKPFGHMNALFISDANKANVKGELDALEAMLAQGAYIIWNHPGWPDDKSTMYPVHERLIAEGKIHGVEVWNDMESYPIVYDWIEGYGLHPFANSDIHGTIATTYSGRRPMTLVFAKEKTEESVKEALFAGRTLALFNNFLMGRSELIASLAGSCLRFEKKKDNGGFCRYRITNSSDIRFRIRLGESLHTLTIEPQGAVDADIVKGQEITFLNCITGKNRCYSILESQLNKD